MDEKEFLELLTEVLEVEPGKVQLSDNLSDFDWDSLAVLGFISALDAKLDRTFEASTIAAASTPAELLALIDDSVRA